MIYRALCVISTPKFCNCWGCVILKIAKAVDDVSPEAQSATKHPTAESDRHSDYSSEFEITEEAVFSQINTDIPVEIGVILEVESIKSNEEVTEDSRQQNWFHSGEQFYLTEKIML